MKCSGIAAGNPMERMFRLMDIVLYRKVCEMIRAHFSADTGKTE
jgi:hypothetical protein